MTKTVSEIRVWTDKTTSERLLLERICGNVADNGGSFSIEYLGTRAPDNYAIQRYTINWPDVHKNPQNLDTSEKRVQKSDGNEHD
jgi:hypothetical protein